eukprot:Platyproteum_vivax@DN1403_c0_g1_i1.p1
MEENKIGKLSKMWDSFTIPLLLIQIAFAVVFSVFTTYSTNLGDINNVVYYQYYSGVAIMIFVGFGYLMTFLRRYGFTAVGATLWMSCLAIQWSILIKGFWEKMQHDMGTKIEINHQSLIDGLFSAGTVLITFGVLIGRTTPVQLLLVTVLEVFFSTLNYFLCSTLLKGIDVGGSMYVHLFGALFGLSCSFTLSKILSKKKTKILSKESTSSEESDPFEFEESRYTSDLFAFIGTIFLFIYWPSFNGALAPTSSQFRIVINTSLALAASVIVTFSVSKMINGKFSMVDVQNATLAGGVAVGTSADLMIGPGPALVIGVVAGVTSTLGFNLLSPLLKRKVGLLDTCGVLNLHGLPGFIGAVAGIFAILGGTYNKSAYGSEYADIFLQGDKQALYNLYSVLITSGVSVAGGVVTGLLASACREEEAWFEDQNNWVVPENYSSV